MMDICAVSDIISSIKIIQKHGVNEKVATCRNTKIHGVDDFLDSLHHFWEYNDLVWSQDLPPVLRSQELQNGIAKVARNPPSPGFLPPKKAGKKNLGPKTGSFFFATIRKMEQWEIPLGKLGKSKKRVPPFERTKKGRILVLFCGTQMLRMVTSVSSIMREMQYLFGSCFRVLVPTVAVEVFQVLPQADNTPALQVNRGQTNSNSVNQICARLLGVQDLMSVSNQ